MSSETQEKDPFSILIQEKGFVLLDGGLATELEKDGSKLDPALWSAGHLLTKEGCEKLTAVHEAYYNAKADVATTASYQAHYKGFEEHGLGKDQADELLRKSVEVATVARDRAEGTIMQKRLVAVSIGPYAASLADGSEYRPKYGRDDGSIGELVEWHRPRFEALVRAATTHGADVFAMETTPCMAEGLAHVALLQSSPIPGWVSFTCKDANTLCSGEPLNEAVRKVLENDRAHRVVAVGVNCLAPSDVVGAVEVVVDVVKKAGVSVHVIAYPNSGEDWDGVAHDWKTGTGSTVNDLVDVIVRARKAGADVIGGCCRTGPDAVSAIYTKLVEL